MASPTATSTIVTQAFRFMELTPPSSLADNSEKANAANEQYEIALRSCLEQEDFSFARTLVSLPAADVPEDVTIDTNLPFYFPLPTDLVKFRSVQSDHLKWRIDGTVVRTDAPGNLTILYTRLITDEKNLPAMFQTAVSYQLAVLLAPKYVASRTKRADLVSDGANALRMAIQNDAVSASHARWDGQEDQGDWVYGAVR